MDYVWLAVMILLLIGVMFLVRRFDKKAKAVNREEAYRVLDLQNPSEKELKNAIKGLHLYVGRIRKDKEFVALKERLVKKLYPAGQ